MAQSSANSSGVSFHSAERALSATRSSLPTLAMIEDIIGSPKSQPMGGCANVCARSLVYAMNSVPSWKLSGVE